MDIEPRPQSLDDLRLFQPNPARNPLLSGAETLSLSKMNGGGGSLGSDGGGSGASGCSPVRSENEYYREMAELIDSLDSSVLASADGSQLKDLLKQLKDRRSSAVQEGDVSSSGTGALLSSHVGPMVLEALDGFLFVLSSDATVEYVSANVNKYLNFPQGDILNKSIYNFIASTDHEQFSRLLPDSSIGFHMFQYDQMAKERRSQTFTCRFLVPSAAIGGGGGAESASSRSSADSPIPLADSTGSPELSGSRQQLAMSVSAIALPYPLDEHKDEMDFLSSYSASSDSGACLVCVARRTSPNPTSSVQPSPVAATPRIPSAHAQQQARPEFQIAVWCTRVGIIQQVEFDRESNTSDLFTSNLAGQSLKNLCMPADWPVLQQIIESVSDSCQGTVQLYSRSEGENSAEPRNRLTLRARSLSRNMDSVQLGFSVISVESCTATVKSEVGSALAVYSSNESKDSQQFLSTSVKSEQPQTPQSRTAPCTPMERMALVEAPWSTGVQKETEQTGSRRPPQGGDGNAEQDVLQQLCSSTIFNGMGTASPVGATAPSPSGPPVMSPALGSPYGPAAGMHNAPTAMQQDYPNVQGGYYHYPTTPTGQHPALYHPYSYPGGQAPRGGPTTGRTQQPEAMPATTTGKIPKKPRAKAGSRTPKAPGAPRAKRKPKGAAAAERAAAANNAASAAAGVPAQSIMNSAMCGPDGRIPMNGVPVQHPVLMQSHYGAPHPHQQPQYPMGHHPAMHPHAHPQAGAQQHPHQHMGGGYPSQLQLDQSGCGMEQRDAILKQLLCRPEDGVANTSGCPPGSRGGQSGATILHHLLNEDERSPPLVSSTTQSQSGGGCHEVSSSGLSHTPSSSSASPTSPQQGAAAAQANRRLSFNASSDGTGGASAAGGANNPSSSVLVQLLQTTPQHTPTLPTSIASSPLDKLARENKDRPDTHKISTVIAEQLLMRNRTLPSQGPPGARPGTLSDGVESSQFAHPHAQAGPTTQSYYYQQQQEQMMQRQQSLPYQNTNYAPYSPCGNGPAPSPVRRKASEQVGMYSDGRYPQPSTPTAGMGVVSSSQPPLSAPPYPPQSGGQPNMGGGYPPGFYQQRRQMPAVFNFDSQQSWTHNSPRGMSPRLAAASPSGAVSPPSRGDLRIHSQQLTGALERKNSYDPSSQSGDQQQLQRPPPYSGSSAVDQVAYELQMSAQAAVNGMSTEGNSQSLEPSLDGFGASLDLDDESQRNSFFQQYLF